MKTISQSPKMVWKRPNLSMNPVLIIFIYQIRVKEGERGKKKTGKGKKERKGWKWQYTEKSSKNLWEAVDKILQHTQVCHGAL